MARKKIVKASPKTPKINKKESKNDVSLTYQFGPTFQRAYGQFIISPDQLKNLAKSNPFVAVAINKVKQKVNKTKYIIRTKDEKDQEKYIAQVKVIEELLKKPNNNNDTFRTLFGKVLDDVLTIDEGIIEKVRDMTSRVRELYHVPGKTIMPNYDDYGLLQEDAYLQYFPTAWSGTINKNTQPVAKFTQDEILMFQMNPQGDVGTLGKGLSPVEMVINSILTGIQAMLYNSTFFDSAKLPPAMFNLKGISTDEVVAFKNAFETSMSSGNFNNAFTNAEDLTVQTLRPTNSDMQFYELNLWLARTVISAFGLSPEEFGLTMNTNRATAETQKSNSKESGVEPYLDMIAEEINADVIGDFIKIDPIFEEIEFAWDNIDDVDAMTQAQIDQIQIGIGTRTQDELRQRDGFDAIPNLDYEDKKQEVTVKSYNKFEEFYR